MNKLLGAVTASPILFLISAVALVAALSFGLAWGFDRYRDEPRRQWCVDHNYAVAGVSKNSGKFSVNEVVCLDDHRRLVLPE